jgi:hypothetical protein
VSVFYCYTGTICPETGSARRDAMDAYPVDETDDLCELVARGGDGAIEWMDVVVVFYEYTGNVTCYPRRPCAGP